MLAQPLCLFVEFVKPFKYADQKPKSQLPSKTSQRCTIHQFASIISDITFQLSACTEIISVFRSRRVTPAINPTEKKTQEHIRAIFGNLAPIELSAEVIQQNAVSKTLKIPPAVNQNDSFGMTNDQFIGRVSESSDIDSSASEKPQTPTVKRSSPQLTSPGQRSKFMEFFKRNSYSLANTPSKNNSSTASVVPSSHSDLPRDSSSRLSARERAVKFFSKMRVHSGDESGTSSFLLSPTSPETPRTERVVSLPPPVPATPTFTPKFDTRSSNLNVDVHSKSQSAHQANFATRVS